MCLLEFTLRNNNTVSKSKHVEILILFQRVCLGGG